MTHLNDSNGILKNLEGAPKRFYDFLCTISQTSFFDAHKDKESNDDNNKRKHNDPDITPESDNDIQSYSLAKDLLYPDISILMALFPTAFAKYAIATAVKDVLRYALLVNSFEVASSNLPIVVGICDAVMAGMDILLRFHGRWDAYKAIIVSQSSGPITALFLYLLGVVVVIVSPTILDYAKNSVADGGSSKDHRTFDSLFNWAIFIFIIGSFLMSRGHGILWNVWTQAFKYQAEKRLKIVEASTNESNIDNKLDIQGKLAQFQVLLRYMASGIAPSAASWFLFLTCQSAIKSYLIICASFVILCVFVTFIMLDLERESKGKEGDTKEISSNESIQLVEWSEMLPTWMFRWKFESYSAETIPLLQEGIAGRFSDVFFHCGMFSALTEAVRGGYSRIISLRIITSMTSHEDLGRILSVAGLTALASFWLSDISDSNRRLSAFLSFVTLGVGHISLAASSSMFGFYISAAIFGLGEGLSTGLRALIKQDYLSQNGPLKDRTPQDAKGRQLRRQVCNKIGIWTDITLVINSIVVGIIGQFLGMRVASMTFGILATYAAYFSIYILPDTKPLVRGEA